jgi:hypothetical protein
MLRKHFTLGFPWLLYLTTFSRACASNMLKCICDHWFIYLISPVMLRFIVTPVVSLQKVYAM